MTIVAASLTAAPVWMAAKSWKQLNGEIDKLEARVNRQVRMSTMREELAIAEASGYAAPFHPTAVGANHFAMRLNEALN